MSSQIKVFARSVRDITGCSFKMILELTGVAVVSLPGKTKTTGDLTDLYACSGHLEFLEGRRGRGFVARDGRGSKLRWTTTLQITLLRKLMFCHFVLEHCVMSQFCVLSNPAKCSYSV